MTRTNLFTLTAILAVIAAGAASSSEIDYGYTGAAQFFTVPFTGEYQITAAGAQGGNAGGNVGGEGAKLGGLFDLTAGDTLELDVGGQGGYGYSGGSVATTVQGVNISSFHYGAGGGGASWVRDNGFDLLLTAGGGGGAGALLPIEDTNPNIFAYGFKPDSPGSGGSAYFAYEGDGSGGVAGHNYNGSSGGGGGGTGFYLPGGSPAQGGGQGGGVTPEEDGGFHNILVGGLAAGNLAGAGGFGGGGGGDANGAGGGGAGYTGGEGGSLIIGEYITGYSSVFGLDPEAQYGYETTGLGGDGGSSYFNGVSLSPNGGNARSQMGNGAIEIVYSDTQITGPGGGFIGPGLPGGVPEPATWTMMIIGAGMVGGVLRRRPRPLVPMRVKSV
jgi:hypothetical protein